jgi:hypothetical protein
MQPAVSTIGLRAIVPMAIVLKDVFAGAAIFGCPTIRIGVYSLADTVGCWFGSRSACHDRSHHRVHCVPDRITDAGSFVGGGDARAINTGPRSIGKEGTVLFSGFLQPACGRERRLHAMICSENLDLSRFQSPAYEESLPRHLQVKYRNAPIGVVVAVGMATSNLSYATGRSKSTPRLPG